MAFPPPDNQKASEHQPFSCFLSVPAAGITVQPPYNKAELIICNLKYHFYAHENMDFLKNFLYAPKYRKHARIKNQGAA